MITFNNQSQFSAQLSADNQKTAASFRESEKTAAVFEQIFSGSTGIFDYNGAIHKPQINGVELAGDKSASELYLVSENTTAGWNSNPQYLPKQGEICIYTDHTVIVDDRGETVAYPDIKIGDGNSYLIDMPFVSAGTRYALLSALYAHESNTIVHITQEERVFWNNKLNNEVSGETLVFTRN